MQQMHSISYGSSGLILDPIIHALAINAPVYCGLGIRVRSSGVAKLEITEHLRFEGIITDPLYVLDTSKDWTSLIIGTFVVTPRGLHAHTPAEVQADPSLWGLSIDHDWTTRTAETVLFF